MTFSNLVLGGSHSIASAAGRVTSRERGHRSHLLMGRVSKLCGRIVKPAHTVTNSSYWAGFASFSVLLSPAPLLQFLEPLPSCTCLQPSSPALLWEHPREDTVQSFNLQKKKKKFWRPSRLIGWDWVEVEMNSELSPLQMKFVMVSGTKGNSPEDIV